ncbi:MAG: hypothetical protein QXD82_03770 [Nitrososphaerales archaeon]
MNKEGLEGKLVKKAEEKEKAKKRKRGPYRKSAPIPEMKPKKEES